MKKTINTLTTLVISLTFLACGSSTSNSGNAQANSTHAYITNGNSLKIVDITNASTPVLKGNVALGSSRFVSVGANYAYVGEYKSADPYVNIIDISNKTAPSVTTSIAKTTPFGLITDMYIDNNTAYTTDEYQGLHIIDIANTAFQSQVLTGSDAMSVTLLGGNMFILHQGATAGIKKYDMSTALSPVFLTQIANPNVIDTSSYPNAVGTNSHHSWIENDGTNLFLANVKFKNFKKFDDTLTELSSINIGGYVTALAIDGNYAFITMHNSNIPLTGGFDGVKMIDLTTMTVIDSKILVKASGVSVQDNKLYVTDSTGLHIYDTSANNMSLVTTLPTGNGNFITLAN